MVHPSTSQPLKAVKLSLALIYLQQTSGYGDGVSRRGLKYLLTDLLPACHLLRPPSTTSILARTLHPPESSFIGQKREKNRKKREFIFYVVQVSQSFRNPGHRIFGEFLCEFVRVFDCFVDAVSALPNVSVSRLPSLSQLHFTPKLFGFRSSSALWIAPLPRLTYYCVVLVLA